MCARIEFTQENLNHYLNELAKEYKKQNKGNILIEIILVGGAAIIANYNFRDMTSDIDAVLDKSFTLKDAIYKVASKHNLSDDWLNSDFMKTISYSHKLRQYSVHYKTFCNCIEVRTIQAEYLIAMKLISARIYKYDLSDILGIIREQNNIGKPITFEKIDKAVRNLYGSWDMISNDSINFLKSAFNANQLDSLYIEVRNREKKNKKILTEIDKEYPDLIKGSNINDIISKARKTTSK